MSHSSEYQFPIFISSTEYNLVDLRAELANYLVSLGYRPILSSATGFPDKSPTLEPWESCLPVLETCFLMILIIDGRYGTPLEWPNYKDIIGETKIAPTHGEYVFASKNKKRILIFVRKEIVTYYDVFKNLKKNKEYTDIEIDAKLVEILPDRIDPKAIRMFGEVKTTRPIPWITEFENITDLKSKLQKKLLNELVELFQLKEKRLETVINAFQDAMNDLSDEKQEEIFKKFNYSTSISKLENERQEIQNELDSAREELKKNAEDVAKNAELQSKINSLSAELKTIKSQPQNKIAIESTKRKSPISGNHLADAITGTGFIGNIPNDFLVSSDSSIFNSHSNIPISSQLAAPVATFLSVSSSPYIQTTRCSKCFSEIKHDFRAVTYHTRKCMRCGKEFCHNCWPTNVVYLSGDCPDCQMKSPLNSTFGKL